MSSTDVLVKPCLAKSFKAADKIASRVSSLCWAFRLAVNIPIGQYAIASCSTLSSGEAFLFDIWRDRGFCLAALRHTTIAFITGPLHLKSALARREAFKKSMQEIGLEVAPELIVVGDHTMEAVSVRLLSLLAYAVARQPSSVRTI